MDDNAKPDKKQQKPYVRVEIRLNRRLHAKLKRALDGVDKAVYIRRLIEAHLAAHEAPTDTTTAQ